MPRQRANLEPKHVKLDAHRFEEIVRAHEAFASGRPGGARALPRFVIAKGMRCDKRLLRDVDFTGSDLTGTTFVGTDLRRAALYCAVMTKCDLRGAHLERADLRGATFAGAKLAGACLDEADMRAAILCVTDAARGLRRVGAGVELGGARLDGANLEDAVAFNVDFTNCSLRSAKLRNANLKNANFTNANLDGVDFKGARIAGVTFAGAILTNVDVEALFLSPAQKVGCVFDPGPEAWARADEIRHMLDGAETWIRTNGSQGGRARLDGLDLRPIGQELRSRMLGGLSARNVVAVGVDFSGAHLQGAVFDGADLRGASFRGADLRGASFLDARLSHAVLQDANISPLPAPNGGSRPTRFDRATLEGTGLFHAAPAATVAA